MPEAVERNYIYNITAANVEPLKPLELELICYKKNWPVELGGLGPAGHFKKIAEILYGPKSAFPFIWNPWAERMNEVIHEHPITKQVRPHCHFSGCANSNKSNFAGLYAIINWMCDPFNTYVFVTSTSIPDSKHRVGKSINKMFDAVPELSGIGAKIDSLGKIITLKPGKRKDDSAGIFVIAGSPSKAREGVGKLIGRKNPRVILIADELPELSPAILDAAFGNLVGNPFFQFVGLGNFKNRYDPFGEVVEPKDGWESINLDSEEWECAKHGAYCVRFDGMKSPNILAGKDIYPFLYGSKQLREHRQSYKENSAPFMRMCRSFETGIGDDDTIYSESDFMTGKAYEQTIWLGPYTRVAGADPAFTNGGDRFILYFGKYGQSKDGIWTLQFDHFVHLHEDVRLFWQKTRSYQMAEQIYEKCTEWGVKSEHFALDSTGAGGPFADVVQEVWTQKIKQTARIFRVDFSGSPTDRVATQDGKPAKHVYDRRVTEIWYVGREFLKGGQFKGVSPEMAREAKARKYETVKGPEGLKMKAETKADMKERLMFSPDIFEAAMIMTDLCRERLRFVPKLVKPAGNDSGPTNFKSLALQVHRVYRKPAFAA